MTTVSQKLKVPEPETETPLLARFFRDNGLNQQTVLQAVSLVNQRTDVFLRDALAVANEVEKFESACKAGCGYCCHTLVSVSPPEVFYIAEHLAKTCNETELKEAKSRVFDYVERTAQMDGGARYSGRESCPFLREDDWYCGLHEARAQTCRAMHSGSLPACLASYNERNSLAKIPSLAVFFKPTRAYYSAYGSVFQARGIPCYTVELGSALAIVWREEDAFDRWLGGEDIFDAAKVSRFVASEQTGPLA